jgi:predicted ferric reductase
MKTPLFLFLFIGLFVLIPLCLAFGQAVPALSGYQVAVLFVSLGAFGLMPGLFFLTRLLPAGATRMKLTARLRWHKAIGTLAGIILLLHPVLMIARRFRVEESNPIDNLVSVLRAPLLRSGIAAWILLAVILLLGLFRKRFPAKLWRIQHAGMSVAFVVLATCHVVSVGRHSDIVLSAFWIVLSLGAIAATMSMFFKKKKGEVCESAQS